MGEFLSDSKWPNPHIWYGLRVVVGIPKMKYVWKSYSRRFAVSGNSGRGNRYLRYTDKDSKITRRRARARQIRPKLGYFVIKLRLVSGIRPRKGAPDKNSVGVGEIGMRHCVRFYGNYARSRKKIAPWTTVCDCPIARYRRGDFAGIWLGLKTRAQIYASLFIM